MFKRQPIFRNYCSTGNLWSLTHLCRFGDPFRYFHAVF